MNKRENVINLLKTKKAEWIPAGFWIHFPKEIQSPDDIVQAHREFAIATNLDISKIMNENEFRSAISIKRASEWQQIKCWKKNDSLFLNQKDIINRILDTYNGEYYTLGTIHGIVASLSHSSGIKYLHSLELMQAHYKENPASFKTALKITLDNVMTMVQVTLDTAVDGIYYAALGGEKHRFDDEFFQEVIAPYDRMLLDTIQSKPIFLHMCKNNVELQRFKDYPCDVVNWACYDSDYSLEKGAAIFPDKILSGGLDDRAGVIVDGTQAEIKQEVNAVLSRMAVKPFILGADCTLPTEIDYQRIRTAVDSINGFQVARRQQANKFPAA